ncbi:MAG: nicotinate phosphoribosyltransferase [Desulfobacterales bacterium]|nr:nicotinate phosphoribosyltransferase [Desulfobacterales bacterium]
MIINSLIDTDLYKFTMMQAVFHQFPSVDVEYEFKCRTKDIDINPYADKIKNEISNFCNLRFQKNELDYLKSLHFFKDDFINFLKFFQLDESAIKINTEKEFSLTIRGPWLHTILFEVPVLSIISEIYSKDKVKDKTIGREKLLKKIELIKNNKKEGMDFTFSDFGTRRRFSYLWHKEVIETLKKEIPENFTGTSNLLLAMNYNIKAVGTMAHEWLMAFQAMKNNRLVDSQKVALEVWAKEYRGGLAVALTDSLGFDAFLRDFDLYFAKLYDGCRHDSGDPIIWGEKLIKHYLELGIDPLSKTGIFSDGLSVEKALNLHQYFKEKIKTHFGIGTNLTNDMGFKTIQIVIKMTRCEGQPVAKISDSPGKQMCRDEEYLNYLRRVFKLIDHQ